MDLEAFDSPEDAADVHDLRAAQEVADALPNATLVVFPGFTHVQLGQQNACAFDVLRQFVDDPTAELDLTYVEGLPSSPSSCPTAP